MEGLIPEAYAPFAQSVFAAIAQPAAVTNESDVAEAVWRAANDRLGSSDSQQVLTPWRWVSLDERLWGHILDLA